MSLLAIPRPESILGYIKRRVIRPTLYRLTQRIKTMIEMSHRMCTVFDRAAIHDISHHAAYRHLQLKSVASEEGSKEGSLRRDLAYKAMQLMETIHDVDAF